MMSNYNVKLNNRNFTFFSENGIISLGEVI